MGINLLQKSVAHCALFVALFLTAPLQTFGSTASLVAIDRTTQGTWKGVYGQDGFNVVNEAGSFPSYATVRLSGATPWIWSYDSNETAALQKSSGNNRIASCWYAQSSFRIDVNLTDGRTHRIALYCLDWDNLGRQQTITVTDSTNGEILNSQTLTGFSKGAWVVWDISDRVSITVQSSVGNAVASGLFFGGDPASNSPPPEISALNGTSAKFIASDTARQGNWEGTYGADGGTIANLGGTLPGYARVEFSAATPWVWNYNSTDIAALQKNTGGDRIASCWYAASAFSIDLNLTDGQAHRVALYFLDWDAQGRKETVTISDAETGVVLNSQTITDFRSGVWLVWDIKGHVTVSVRSSTSNAVATSLLFGRGASGVTQVQQVAAPSITPAGGTFSGPVTVSMSSATDGATICYTTDGSTPSSSSPVYAAPFSPSTTVTLKAKAFKAGMTDSSITSATFSISNPTPPASTLSDLASLPNRVFPAPEGFDTVQYAPDGKLGMIVWRDQQLIFRERNGSGGWNEDIVSNGGGVFKMLTSFTFSGPREDYRFQPAAVLFYDSASQAHVFQASGRNIMHYVHGPGGWQLSETISASQANDNIAVLVGAIGPNNVFHLGVLSAGSPRNLTYGSNKSGQWSWSTISNVSDASLTYWAPPYAPRWLSLAADSKNNAHLTFRTSMDLSYDGAGHPRAYSQLKYASNSSGQWQIGAVHVPDDISAEAANGASIAIATDDKPRIVSWYNDRGDGGSSSWSRLYYHDPDGSGGWTHSIVLGTPDGYSAGDGPKGTGFSPSLKFDAWGRAHILFLDHAGEHFGGIGQQEYAGNLRHAWWTGSGWSVENIYRQVAPLEREIVYPAFALRGNEMAVTLLQRETKWNYSAYPPLSDSTYYFRFFTKTLP